MQVSTMAGAGPGQKSGTMNSKQVSQVHARNLIPGGSLLFVQVCVSKKLESGAGTEYEIKVL